MFEFLNLKPEAFGLDIADYSCKFAKLKKGGKSLRLSSWGEIEIKPGLVQDGEIKNEDALASALKEGLSRLKGEKLNTKNIIASLPEKKSFLQVIQMPKMKEEELRSAIRFEAENYVPLPIEEVYLDYQIVSPFYDHLDHNDVLIVASPKQTVNSYVSCIKKMGFIPQALEIESQSIARALIKNETSGVPVLLVDFGKNATGVTIYSGKSLRFTSTIPISSQQLTDAIARVMKIDAKEAEGLKIKYGLQMPEDDRKAMKSPDGAKIFEAMVPVLSDLTGQIKKCLIYYKTHSSHEHLSAKGKEPRGVEKIVLCGGGSNLKGLIDFFSSSLNLPVELGNPWTNILPNRIKEIPKIPLKESFGYTSALGLALRGVQEENII